MLQSPHDRVAEPHALLRTRTLPRLFRTAGRTTRTLIS